MSNDKITITKKDLHNALTCIADQNRFFRPGRYQLCRQVYKGVGKGVTYDCDTYLKDGIDELFTQLKKGKK